jgi:hypothetical protein
VSVCAAGGRNGASAGKGNDGGGKAVELYLSLPLLLLLSTPLSYTAVGVGENHWHRQIDALDQHFT